MVQFYNDNGIFGILLWIAAIVLFSVLFLNRLAMYQEAKQSTDTLTRLGNFWNILIGSIWFVLALSTFSAIIFSIIDYGLF